MAAHLAPRGERELGRRACLGRGVATRRRKVAAIVSRGDAGTLAEVTATCTRVAGQGEAVRVFFRDESIPSLCRAEIAISLMGQAGPAAISEELEALAGAGDVRLYACSSSLYLWGVRAGDLLPSITGSRGLIAFLAEDMDDAQEVLSY